MRFISVITTLEHGQAIRHRNLPSHFPHNVIFASEVKIVNHDQSISAAVK